MYIRRLISKREGIESHQLNQVFGEIVGQPGLAARAHTLIDRHLCLEVCSGDDGGGISVRRWANDKISSFGETRKSNASVYACERKRERSISNILCTY